MSIATNSLNINSSGIVAFNAATGVFTESAVTQHDTLVGGASNSITSVAPGTTGHALVSNGAAADPSYSTTIVVGGGGTGATTLTGVLTGNGTAAFTASAVTQHDVLIGGAANAVVSVSPSTAGFVLTSNGTGSDPSFKASTSVTWIDVTTGTQTIAAGTGYVTDNATQVTYTLPASPNFGDEFKVTGGVNGSATAPWLIATNAGQSIILGNTTATTSVASTLQYDSIDCVCVVAGASAVFVAQNSVGNLIFT